MPNPDLKPETIRTFEAVVERQLGRDVRLTVSAFDNRIDRLISFQFDPDLARFENAEAIDSRGVELAAEARRRRVAARVSYSFQRTTDARSGAALSNSPRHMAKLSLGLPLGGDVSGGFEAQYMSEREAIGGGSVDGFLLANLTLRAPRLLGRLDASASVDNLFDTRYADPGSEEHLQETIPQPRRSFRVKLAVRF